jgi:hypothetical protein
MGAFRANVAQFVAGARGEMRLALAGVPALAWRALIIAAWASTAIVLGGLIGFMSVILPPIGMFILILAAAALLLWVMPDLPQLPDALIRRMFFIALVVDVTIPIYYAIRIEPLPLISLRRLVTYPLIALFAFAYSSSAESRRRIAHILSRNRVIAICVFGFPIVAFLSIFTSINPTETISSIVDMIIGVYAPFVLVLYVIRSHEDVEKFIRIFIWATLVISLIGILDFILQRNLYLDAMPKFLLDGLLENNPFMQALVYGNKFRNGMYRAPSMFENSLSFAEFEAMMATFAAIFAIHGPKRSDKALGWVTLVACLLGVFASGSRGGYLAVFVGSVALVGMALIRTYRFEPTSLKPATVGMTAATGFFVVVMAVVFVPKFHNIVIGGGVEQQSDEGRRIQWAMGIPKVERYPLTGQGYGLAAEIVGYTSASGFPTIDSFLLAVLAETGVLGVVTYFGAIAASIWIAYRRYISDRSWPGALMGGLGSALVAYFTYRFYLAQRENTTNMYLLISFVIFLNYYYMEGKERVTAPQASDGAAKLASPLPHTPHRPADARRSSGKRRGLLDA